MSSPNVLVVDDEEGIREYLRVLLAHAGYQVRTAADGREALALLAEAPADVVLLDLMMPVMDGWVFLEKLHALETDRKTPVVVLSAIEHAPPQNVAAILVKPSSPSQILSVVAKVLGRERRVNPRFPASFTVHGSDGRTTVHDVSRGGLCFGSNLPHRVGQKVTLTLELPIHGNVLVETEVRHVATAAIGWRVGARFVEVRQNQDALDAMLSSLEAVK
jgi:CheY-like chemotaxis protein